jgi:hypothetical protein
MGLSRQTLLFRNAPDKSSLHDVKTTRERACGGTMRILVLRTLAELASAIDRPATE